MLARKKKMKKKKEGKNYDNESNASGGHELMPVPSKPL